MDWYYADETDQQTQFEESQFRSLIDQGKLKSDTLVWNSTMPDWTQVSLVRPELFAPVTPAAAQQPIVATNNQPTTSAAVPPQGSYYPQQPPVDGMGIASLVCGILSILGLCSVGPFALIVALPAVICGHMAKKHMHGNSGTPQISGFAMAGLIMGYITLAFSLIAVIFVVVALVFGGMSGGF